VQVGLGGPVTGGLGGVGTPETGAGTAVGGEIGIAVGGETGTGGLSKQNGTPLTSTILLSNGHVHGNNKVPFPENPRSNRHVQ